MRKSIIGLIIGMSLFCLFGNVNAFTLSVDYIDVPDTVLDDWGNPVDLWQINLSIIDSSHLDYSHGNGDVFINTSFMAGNFLGIYLGNMEQVPGPVILENHPTGWAPFGYQCAGGWSGYAMFQVLEDIPNLDDLFSIIVGWPLGPPSDLEWGLNAGFGGDISESGCAIRTTTPVPEPASIFLLGFGLLGLSKVVRGKKYGSSQLISS